MPEGATVRQIHAGVGMTPAQAKAFITAVDVAIASHNAAAASLYAMRQILIASVGSDDRVDVPISGAIEPSAAIAPAAAPIREKGKGGRPRKHFMDRAAPATGAERMTFSRRQRNVAKQVSQHTLSLEENTRFLGRESRAAKSLRNSNAAAMPLPLDFQPDEQGARLSIEKLGEIGAANCLAKFRDHYAGSGELRTAARWQGKFRNWVRDERGFATTSFATISQPGLPLMRDLGGGKNGVTIKQCSPQADAWEKHRGKTIPWGKSGLWSVPTEWPPGHELGGSEPTAPVAMSA